MIEELVTVTTAAEILQTGRTTVLFLIAEDRLTAYRLPPNSKQKGRKLYLPRREVERIAASDWRRHRKRGTKEGPAEYPPG